MIVDPIELSTTPNWEPTEPMLFGIVFYSTLGKDRVFRKNINHGPFAREQSCW